MKRDMDFIREILLQIEGREPKQSLEVKSEGRDRQEIVGHVRLLQEARFVEATFTGGPTAMVHRLTWDDHEFLDSVRDPTIWAKVTKRLKKVGGFASVDVIKTLAIAAIKEQIGLGGGDQAS